MGDLHFPHDNCSRRATETRFTVTSNALLRVDGQTRFGYVSEYYDTSNRVFKVLAEKGGEIRFKGQLFNYDVCRINIGARDNGSLVFGDGANTVHYLGGVNLVTAKVEVVDSKLELVDTFVLGGKYNNAIIGNELSFAGMHFSNAVVRTGIGEGGTRRLYVANGEIESIDSDWESRNLYLGYKNGISKLAIKSGRFNQLGEFKIGCEAGGKAELSFEGGESTIAPPEKGASYFGWTLGSESVMRISGGKLKFVIPESDSFFIGYGTSATATVYQTGGEFLVKGEGGLIVGSDGVGNYEMQGGTLITDQIRLGYGFHKRGVQIFRQTGGFADIRSTDIWHGVNVCDSPSNCKLVLDGGVMQCNSIRGWNGSTSKGSTGWAVLEADGGTLRASQKSEVQIENFDEAKLGTNGLTVESVFDITIKQGFTDQEDELGVLALTGSGVKTLTATNSTQSRLTATGGLVKFAPTAGVNARHYSAASFAGGSGLSLEGNQSEAVFSSLSLGDETSFAVIKLDVGDVVRSDSAIENLTRVKVSLSGTLAAGKYVLVRCKGAVQDEVRNNWILESELLSSKPAGCGALFSVDYDNALDETLFAVEFVPYSDEIPSNILSGDLQIPDLVSVDAVHFNSSDPKKIEGEGALIIADSILDALRVDGGHHEIASKLSLPCGMMAEAVIAKDASLDISGVILRGGLRKSGLGLLELSAHNMFGIGFVQDGGTSVLKYGDSAGNGSITVSDGTLVFDGEQDETPDP
jgi:hypothetical protein